MPQTQIKIEADNQFQLNDKVAALNKIKQLDPKLLKELGSIIDDPKEASKKLSSKMKLLKTFF